MRLVRWAFWLSLIGGTLWVGFAVPLGELTLVGHLRAIAGSRETSALFAGVGGAGERLVEGVRRHLFGGGIEPATGSASSASRKATAGGESPEPPEAHHGRSEKIDDSDRGALDRLVRERTKQR